MPLRTGFKALCIALLSLLLSNTAGAGDPNQKSVLNIVFSNGDAPAIDTSYQDLMNNVTSIINLTKAGKGPYPTSVNPLFYNTNISNPKYVTNNVALMNFFNNHSIAMYLGLGPNGDGTNATLNTALFLDLAARYYEYTDCIQISGAQTYYDNSAPGFASFLGSLRKMGFKHIQLNPWPSTGMNGGGAAATFSNPAVDSAQEQVLNTTISASMPRWGINAPKMQRIFESNPTVQISINYENPPQQKVLAGFSLSSQINVFNITLMSIQNSVYGPMAFGGNDSVHWSAPWSKNYNPWTNGTWNYIKNQLSGNGAFNL